MHCKSHFPCSKALSLAAVRVCADADTHPPLLGSLAQSSCQQVFMECLLCTRHHAWPQGHSGGHTDMASSLSWTLSLEVNFHLSAWAAPELWEGASWPREEKKFVGTQTEPLLLHWAKVDQASPTAFPKGDFRVSG